MLRALPLPPPTPATSGAFVALDDLLIERASKGLRVFRLQDESLAATVASHVQRRCREVGRSLTLVAGGVEGPALRELGVRAQASQALAPTDVEEAAAWLRSMAQRTGPSVLLARLRGACGHDVAVAQALVRDGWPGESLLVLLVDEAACELAPSLCAATPGARATLRSAGASGEGDQGSALIDASLGDEALSRWWAAWSSDALSQLQGALPGASLRDVEAFAAFATSPLRAGKGEARIPAAARPELLAHPLVQRLRLAGRAWPVTRLSLLAERAPLDALERAGHVLVSGSLASLSEEASSAIAHDVSGRDGSELREVAGALLSCHGDDAWATERAAELLVAAGDLDAACDAHERALRLADDAVARHDLWARWAGAVDTLSASSQRPLLLRGAELSLARGDVDVAQRWAERAASSGPADVETTLLLGRAALGRGDLLSAEVTLTRGLEQATTSDTRAAVLAELSEVRYAQGRLDEARALATEADDLTTRAITRLAARNTLGKLLLAQGAWGEAEALFAAEATQAACSLEHSAGLRARVNRAIAVLSSGRESEAQPMLDAVLRDGEATGDHRAIAFALSNLAVIAINRHQYGEALRLSELSIGARRRLGERLGLARVTANLAELRLRLGLVREAEQALTFGRQTAQPEAPLPRTSHFALISARIHLARGDTMGALRELDAAIAGAPRSSDGDMLCECHRVACRVALEDGDVERASCELSQAEQLARAPSARAEVVLLDAQLARARGAPAYERCVEAITHARRAGDEELLREAHTLACEMSLSEGRPDRARPHLTQAIALRDRVADGLSSRLRDSYLARRDLAVLQHLEARLASDEPASSHRPTTSEPLDRCPPSRASISRELIGTSPQIRALLDNVRKVARTDATVLLLGESGTGKELIAEAVHAESPRRGAPLVKVNCAALVESLLLSELFGHEKGAFTGAAARKRGRFELAEGGTLFLDEIGDISPATQVALLRVLQERTFERVGGATPIRANVRVVCATHRDLRTMVERGEFRQDLYFRLSGIVLHVPSLRSRLGDLPALCDGLLQRIADERGEAPRRLSPEALSLLARHGWPGNVRELENALRAASLFADGVFIQPTDIVEHVPGLRDQLARVAPAIARPTPTSPVLPPGNDGDGSSVDSDEADLGDDEASNDACDADAQGPCKTTDIAYAELKSGKLGLFDLKRKLERDCIARALAETRGNITRAATILGMKRPRLSQLVKQYGLSANSLEGS